MADKGVTVLVIAWLTALTTVLVLVLAGWEQLCVKIVETAMKAALH